MSKALPPLTWFRAFEAAARKLSFTAAAAEIGMTQSAVSQHVKALEGRLGVTLFNRHPRGLSLTDDGRKLMPQVDVALESLAQAIRTFDAGPTQNLLTIATSVSMSQWVIAPHLRAFTDATPGVRVRFISTIWPDDFHAVLADVDIPFGSQSQVGHDAVFLEPSKLVAVKSPVLTGDLNDLPLIASVGTSDGWHMWQEIIGGQMRPQIFVDTYGAALDMAVHGNGVALVSELLAAPALRAGQLVTAHPARISGNEGYYLRRNGKDPASIAFCDWLTTKVLPASHHADGR